LKEPGLVPWLFQFNATIIHWHIRMDWTPLPKSAIHKQRNLPLWKNKIGE
jgi:hypothetical protein